MVIFQENHTSVGENCKKVSKKFPKSFQKVQKHYKVVGDFLRKSQGSL